MPLDEAWSWSKFFTGFISGKNYAKAVVMMFCMVVILIIVFSVASTIKSRFGKSTGSQSTETIGTNQGIVATQNEDKSGNSYSLFNLFNWK